MKRFFTKIPFSSHTDSQEYINTKIGVNIVDICGEKTSMSGTSPWEYCFSSGLLLEEQFEVLDEYFSNKNDCVFIDWDGSDWNQVSHYYQGQYGTPI